MNWIKINWFKIGLIILAIFILGWYGIRPALITKHCAISGLERAKEMTDGTRDDYEYFYSRCLREKGIKKEIYASVLH